MSANNNAVFGLTGNNTPINFTTANTGLTGGGTIPTLLTPGGNGTIWRGIQLKACETTLADVVRVWLSHDSGTTWYLFDEITVTVVTSSNTGPAFNYAYTPPFGPMLLKTTDYVGLSTAIGQRYHATPIAEDL